MLKQFLEIELRWLQFSGDSALIKLVERIAKSLAKLGENFRSTLCKDNVKPLTYQYFFNFCSKNIFFMIDFESVYKDELEHKLF